MKSGLQPDQLLRKFDSAVKNALVQSANQLDSQFTKEINSKKWDWPNETKRKNGKTVTAPRDIVDLGKLRSSQTRQQTGRYSIEWIWNVDYSAVVHNGARLKGGGTYKARPWTKTAEEEVKPLGYFADILRRELDG
jgi:hypothetical protein|tara:strand:- start:4825 stop:5232 length:408 start_codon:yes stop_codon:yes gene_type:complete